jgi:hypothetical protein
LLQTFSCSRNVRLTPPALCRAPPGALAAGMAALLRRRCPGPSLLGPGPTGVASGVCVGSNAGGVLPSRSLEVNADMPLGLRICESCGSALDDAIELLSEPRLKSGWFITSRDDENDIDILRRDPAYARSSCPVALVQSLNLTVNASGSVLTRSENQVDGKSRSPARSWSPLKLTVIATVIYTHTRAKS